MTACNKSAHKKSVTKTNFLLDTMIKIQAFGPDAPKAIDKVFERISDIEKKMTVKDVSSEVIEINNKSGESFYPVSPDTFYVIKKGLYYSESSNGMFDITVGPLVELWGIGTDTANIPTDEEIKRALAKVDYRQVELNEEQHSVRLKKTGMAIDLGGIAKGYAADEAIRILQQNGIQNALIDLGGNLYALGTKPDNKPWKIGLQNPFATRGNIFATIQVADKTLVTSGIYERYFTQNGKRYHHILDTTTGYPIENGLASVTIISNSSIDADALSTTVFALGLKDGMEFVESLKQVDAVFVSTDYKLYTSSGIKQYDFQIINDKFRLENNPVK